MKIVQFFQSLNSPVFSFFASCLNFFSSFPFFVVFFAIVFLFYSKDDAYKLSIFAFINFVFGALFLKNIFGRSRPYEVDPALFADRSYFTKSFPSVSSMNFAGVLLYPINQSKNKAKKLSENDKVSLTQQFSKNSNAKNFLAKNTLQILFAVLIFLIVLSSKFFFAENYFSDILVGGALGVGSYFLVFKIIKKVNHSHFLFFLIAPLAVILFFYNEFFSAGYTLLFEVSGFFSAVVLGSFLEKKYVKIKIKNNFIFSFSKALILFIFLTLCYFLNSFLLSGMGLLSFLCYFLTALGITFLLPMLFKICEKYCYVFAEKSNEKNLIFSKISLSEKSTQKIARKISTMLRAGDVLLLEGDLGAGKSVIVREILKTMGVKGKITSPTFTLVNEYFAEKNHFYHFDMYRIEDEEEVKNLGFEDILNDAESIKFVEWPSKFSRFLPEKHLKIIIVKLSKNCRNIILEEAK